MKRFTVTEKYSALELGAFVLVCVIYCVGWKILVRRSMGQCEV